MKYKYDALNKKRNYLIVILVLLLAVIGILGFDIYDGLKEYNDVSNSKDLYIEEIHGQVARIENFKYEDGDDTGFIAQVPFKNLDGYVYVVTADEYDETKLDKAYVGIFEITEEGYILLYQIDEPQFAGFYYNNDHRNLSFVVIGLSVLFIFLLVRGFKYLKAPKGPVFEKGSPIDKDKMNEILSKESTIDNVWVDEEYLLINDSNYITSKKLSEVIWVYYETFTGRYNTTYIVSVLDRDGEKIEIPFTEYLTANTFYDILRKKLPNAVHGYSKEKKNDFRDNKDIFLSTYLKENENINSDDIQNSENSTDYTQILKQARKDDSKIFKSGSIAIAKFVLIPVLFMGLMVGLDEYLPKLIVNYFYKSDINPALSMLKVGFYSRLFVFLAIAILLIVFLIIMIREFFSKWKTINMFTFKKGVIMLFVVWTALIVMMAHGMVTDDMHILQVSPIYSDIKQIEDNKLIEKDIYIEGDFYKTEDNNYLIPYSKDELFKAGTIVGIDYPLNEKSVTTAYYVPWKSECPIDITKTGFNRGKAENYNAKVYRIKYTENNHLIVELKEVN